MNRRTAIGTAVAVVLVVLSASAALALNVGIIDSSADESVDAVTVPPSTTAAADPEIVVEYVDVYEDGTEVPVTSPAPGAAAATPVGGTGGVADSPQAAPSSSPSTAAPSGPRYETVVVDGVAEVTVAVHGPSDMEFWSAVPIGAWQYAVEDLRGDEIEVEFRSSSREVELKLTLVDGELRSFVEAEDADASGDDEYGDDHDDSDDDYDDDRDDDLGEDDDHDDDDDDHGEDDDDDHDEDD